MISVGDNCERNTKDHNIFSSPYTGHSRTIPFPKHLLFCKNLILSPLVMTFIADNFFKQSDLIGIKTV